MTFSGLAYSSPVTGGFMRGPLPILVVLGVAGLALGLGSRFTTPTPTKPEWVPPPGFQEVMKRMEEDYNAPAEVQKRKNAVATCNHIFNVKSNVENAVQFLKLCHAEKVRKDCLQSSKDWTTCVVELYIPDPARTK
jgi:hypothetical protein